MTITPRSREPEFADTPTDRAALIAILNAAGRPHGDDLTAMNAEWDQLILQLFHAQNEGFDHWADAAADAVAKADKPVRQRVSEIIGHLVGWRIGDV